MPLCACFSPSSLPTTSARPETVNTHVTGNQCFVVGQMVFINSTVALNPTFEGGPEGPGATSMPVPYVPPLRQHTAEVHGQPEANESGSDDQSDSDGDDSGHGHGDNVHEVSMPTTSSVAASRTRKKKPTKRRTAVQLCIRKLKKMKRLHAKNKKIQKMNRSSSTIRRKNDDASDSHQGQQTMKIELD